MRAVITVTRHGLAAFALLVIGCGANAPPDRPLPAAGSDLAGDCPETASTSVASALDTRQPCRDWVEATYHRVASVGSGKSGAIWSISSKGAAVFVTCQHCFGTSGGLTAPRGGNSGGVVTVGTAPERTGDRVTSGQPVDNTNRFHYAYVLYAPKPPPSATDARGNLTNIKPVDDWVVSAMPGKVFTSYGHLALVPPESMPTDPLAVRDPAKLLGVETTGEPVPGELALTLGFPAAGQGAMMFTAGAIHTDARAAEIISRAEKGEREIAYDPAVEFLVAGQLTVGNSGGGVFDRRGRYLGVMVRGSVEPVDGEHFVRVVRASYIRVQVDKALSAAAPELRAAVEPYLR